jgi:hypothetical protein
MKLTYINEEGARVPVKAVIQTNNHTGVNRVLYHKKVNGITRVVQREGGTASSYRVTGYKSLGHVKHVLKHCIVVYSDEQVLLNGRNCEHNLN